MSAAALPGRAAPKAALGAGVAAALGLLLLVAVLAAVLTTTNCTGLGGPGYSVIDEPPTGLAPAADGQSVVYPRGTIAMAKSQQPNSAGSQFFLVYEDSTLPADYSVMGTIGEKGLATLDKISKAGTKSDDPQSLEMKATFARYAGLRGVNLFDIHGDTDEADLADALRRGLGL